VSPQAAFAAALCPSSHEVERQNAHVAYGLLALQFLHAPNYAFGHIEDLADVVRHALRMEYGVFHMNQHGNEGQPSAFRSFLRATTTAPLVSGVIVLFAVRSRRSANPRADDDGATARVESLDWRIPALGAWIALLIFAAMLRGVDGGAGLALRFFRRSLWVRLSQLQSPSPMFADGWLD
jgi:hypothetical protein